MDFLFLYSHFNEKMNSKKILSLAISIVLAIFFLKILGWAMHLTAYIIWLIMIVVITYPIYLIVNKFIEKK